MCARRNKQFPKVHQLHSHNHKNEIQKQIAIQLFAGRQIRSNIDAL